MRYTRRDAARLAGVSENTLARHVRLGHLPEANRGNTRRKWYDPDDLAVIMEFFARPCVGAGDNATKANRPAGA